VRLGYVSRKQSAGRTGVPLRILRVDTANDAPAASPRSAQCYLVARNVRVASTEVATLIHITTFDLGKYGLETMADQDLSNRLCGDRSYHTVARQLARNFMQSHCDSERPTSSGRSQAIFTTYIAKSGGKDRLAAASRTIA
jgi:hypothetical protein